MPDPIAIGSASTWKIQRGTSFGTTEEGIDWATLVYRGPSSTAVTWRADYLKGFACPLAGLTHCKLTAPPTFRDDGPYFSIAELRFEGPSPLDDEDENPVAKIDYSTERGQVEVLIGGGVNIYEFDAQVVTATYQSDSYPTAGVYLFDDRLANLPDPAFLRHVSAQPKDHAKKVPINAEGIPDGTVKDTHWKFNDWDAGEGSQFSSVEETGDSFTITERHIKFIRSEDP